MFGIKIKISIEKCNFPIEKCNVPIENFIVFKLFNFISIDRIWFAGEGVRRDAAPAFFSFHSVWFPSSTEPVYTESHRYRKWKLYWIIWKPFKKNIRYMGIKLNNLKTITTKENTASYKQFKNFLETCTFTTKNYKFLRNSKFISVKKCFSLGFSWL